jgi:outer membrane receptor protein involved in Fe transport
MLILSPNTITAVVIGMVLAGQPMAQESLVPVLEEVVVTAQKHRQLLSDTPATVNVVTGKQIKEFNTFSFEELSSMTAGLAISGTNFETNIATRGLGTELNAAVWSRVTVYLDEIHLAVERGLFTGLYDLSQLELLRGPQGTLYGQPSPAGVITIQSQDPSLDKVDGYIQQSFTDREGSNSQFGVSLPLLSNKLGVRVSGLYDSNEHSGAENITLNKNLENETKAFRLVTRWAPTDNIDLRLAYHDIEDEFDVDPVVRGNGIAFDDRVALADFDSSMKNESEYIMFDLNYRFANKWTGTLVGSKQSNILTLRLDLDGSPVQGREQFLTSDVSDLYNVELRLASQENDDWDWTIGVFYQDSEAAEFPLLTNTYLAMPGGASLLAETTGVGLQDGSSLGVFMHNSIHLSEPATLTIGLRYNEEERYNVQPFSSDIYRVGPDGSLVFLSSLSSQGVRPEDQESSDDAFTGTLKYQYRFSDHYMAYASYDRGWRGGSAKIVGRPSPPQFGAFEPEESDSLEVGYKWQILNGRGLLNVAAYYQRYSDFHYLAESVEYRDNQGGISLVSPVVNVDEAQSYGFDSDITLLLSAYWQLNGALSYNKAELSDAKDVPCTTGEPLPDELWDFNTCDLTGERAGNQPRWSGNLATQYHQPLLKGSSEWYLRGLLNTESDYYSASEGADLDSYTTLDLFLGLRDAAGIWDARVWIKNVFDESAELKTERLPMIPDYDNGGQLESGLTWIRRQLNPRTTGVTVSYNF